MGRWGKAPYSKMLRHFFLEMFGLRLTAPYAFIVRARGGAVKVGEDTKKPKAKPSVSGAADETESEPEESASVTCLSMNFTCWSSENSRYTCQPHIMGEYNKLEVILLTDCENTIQILDQLLNLQG